MVDRILRNAKLVVSDWSGVISDDRRQVHETNNRMLTHFGLPTYTFEEWLPKTKASWREFFRDHNITLGGDELAQLYQETFPQVVKDIGRPAIYADAEEFIRVMRMRGRFAVLSAHPHDFLRQEAEQYGIDWAMQGWIGGVHDKAEALQDLIDEFDLSAQDVVYIGDMVSDVEHAHRAWVGSVAITTGYHSRAQLAKSKPDVIVDSLTELLDHHWL